MSHSRLPRMASHQQMFLHHVCIMCIPQGSTGQSMFFKFLANLPRMHSPILKQYSQGMAARLHYPLRSVRAEGSSWVQGQLYCDFQDSPDQKPNKKKTHQPKFCKLAPWEQHNFVKNPIYSSWALEVSSTRRACLIVNGSAPLCKQSVTHRRSQWRSKGPTPHFYPTPGGGAMEVQDSWSPLSRLAAFCQPSG